jgi:hypothetical protein
MMIKKRLDLFVLLLIVPFTVLLLGVSSVNTQQRETNETEKLTPLKQTVKKAGWRIPGLEAFTSVSQKTLLQVEGMAVTQKTYQANDEPVFELEGYFLDSVGNLVINSRSCVVRDLHSYGISDRIFAYGVRLVPISEDKDGGRIYYGAMYNLYYVDEDGDGIYETRLGSLKLPKLPEWAKTLNEKSRQNR